MYDGPERRRKGYYPQDPGNYPEDRLAKIRYAYEAYPDANLPDDVLEDLTSPKEEHGILLAADIRNFTRTLEKEPRKNVMQFLDSFFKAAASIVKSIDTRGSFVNKMLGDALFAHMPNASVSAAVEAARKLIIKFNGLKKRYEFKYANLSVALTVTPYLIGELGGNGYTDYTLIGSKVNSLFRMLSRTAGGTIWVSDTVKEEIDHSYFLADLGNLKFKGITPRVTTHAVIRKRHEGESWEDASKDCLICPNLRLCSAAHRKGLDDRMLRPDFYCLSIDCHDCGPENSQCWLWGECRPKHEHKKENKSITCCFMCRNFRNCFHNYQLGRHDQPMVSCDKILNENFAVQ